MHYVVGLHTLAIIKTQRMGIMMLPSPCTSLLSLLADLALNTPLQSLALVVLQFPALLLGLIASETGKGASDSAADTVADALAEIVDLTLCLLALSCGILLLAVLAHALEAERATDGLFAGTDGLVPRASAAVGVVLSDALCADGEAADVTTSVRKVLAGRCFGLLLLGLVLVSC